MYTSGIDREIKRALKKKEFPLNVKDRTFSETNSNKGDVGKFCLFINQVRLY